jgi:hypothetical protein
MPIKTDLNAPPYYDDFDFNKQYYRVLFKPSFAVQARELTQLQTTLQNQIEQFGDNIFKEGSIIKGCNFTELNTLQFVRVSDRAGFDPANYVGGVEEDGTEIFYEIFGSSTQLRASIEAATRGFQTRFPDLNTFYIRYLNTASSGVKVFQSNEELVIFKRTIDADGNPVGDDNTEVDRILAAPSNSTGNSFGLRVSEGVIFQKGHFLFTEEQLVIVSKYTNAPNNVSVGYRIEERIVSFLQDEELLDNYNGSPNQNAPGADRLKLVPILTAINTADAEEDPFFFTLARYVNGNAVLIRDVSQYNVLGEEMARRTYEESGDYITRPFKTQVVDKDGDLKVSIGPGVAYVKGYRIENRGEYQFPILDVAATAIKENQPISFEYGRYVELSQSNTAISGTFDIPSYATVNLKNSSNTTIGTAIVKNVTPSAVYMFEIEMNSGQSFASVDRIEGDTGLIYVEPVIRGDDFGTFIFETGMYSLKSVTSVSLPVRDKKIGNIISDAINIQADPGEDFAVNNSDVIVVDNSNVNLAISSISTLTNNSVLRIQLVPGQTPGPTATVYFNKRIQSTEPHRKVAKETYIKSLYASSTQIYNLGFPDVYEIVEIFDINGVDVTNSFRLVSNQNDHYYDHSYIQYIPGRTQPANGLMTIKLKTFEINRTQGRYFFTINSYPNDFEADKIPLYKSKNGKTYNLRDCFDFRPYVDVVAGADYEISDPAAAPTISPAINLTPSFTGNIVIPALNATATAVIEHYLNRTDVVVLDSYGNVSMINGEENTLSKPPETAGKLVIAEIFVPGFPAISPERAVIENRPQYTIKIVSKGTRNYTMKDIEKIDRRVSKLTYYTSLTALELSTQNLNIRDENGFNRFKNGIIVDSFNDFTVADASNPDFYAGLDFTEKSLIPPVKAIPMNLRIKSFDDVTIHPNTNSPETVTLTKDVSDVVIISQPYATNSRNCVSNFYNYKGSGFIFPEYDGGPDTVSNPAVNFNIDLQPVFEDLIDNIQEFIPLTSTSSEFIGTRLIDTEVTRGRRRFFGLFGPRRTNTVNVFEDTFRDTQREVVANDGVTQSATVDFVTNAQFSPFMRSRRIQVGVYGLRPNTRHYVFFDKQDVNNFVSPAVLTSGDDISQESVRSIRATQNLGDALISNANGEVFFIFNLPEASFYVGDRIIEVVDVNVYDDIVSAATSKAFLTYRAYNFSVEKSGLTLSTRIPDISIQESTSDRDVTRRETPRPLPIAVGDGDGNDPISQTFFIKKAMTGNSKNLFVTQLDLYFRSKSATRGITVELREVINGYPSYQVLPFSRRRLPSRLVITSADASVATQVKFPVPVRLESDKEYAFVVIPDAADPDYLIYTSKVGGTDLITGNPINQDTFDGVLFTSTNNRTWQSYQDEDIKFTLYRANFTDSQGSITLTNDFGEFFTISNTIGRFGQGETVYATKGANISVSILQGSYEITSSGTPPLSLTYAAGDYVLLEGTGVPKNIYRVVDSGAEFLLLDAPVVSNVSSATVNITPVVVGEINYYDFKRPTFMSLERSSARLGRSFAAADTLVGLKTGATTTISSVDNINLSYIQPLIARTNDSVTNVQMFGEFTFIDDEDSAYELPMPFNDKTQFNLRGMQLRSKSNDISETSKFDITLDLLNQDNPTTTPFVDVETATLLSYQYNITNDANTSVRYLSRTVELAEGFDAEDFKMYLTGYRPEGTNIKTYIKIQNTADPVSFETADWIELEMTQGIAMFSSTSNTFDFREYVYEIPSSNKVNGVVTYTNGSGTFEGYKRFAVKIVLLSENNYRVPRVADYRGIALT